MNNSLTEYIKTHILQAGFQKVGIAPAKKLDRSEYLKEWLKLGYHGDMRWMENYLDKRMDVNKLYPQAKSVISVALNYYTPPKHSDNKEYGKISRYAWGEDYHKIMKKKLKNILKDIKQQYPQVEGRLFVDTAPIQDKLWAAEAGIGWQGKNTNILTRDYGSWIFLGELVVDIELEYDKPILDYCGSCTACIDACPTKALEPFKIDATKCISYLTIEMWEKPIPEEFRNNLENWIFGCDICQDVCPWNRFEKPTDEQAFNPSFSNDKPLLSELSEMNEEDFKKRFKKSPVKRAKYHNFIRNVKAAKGE